MRIELSNFDPLAKKILPRMQQLVAYAATSNNNKGAIA